MNLTNLRYTNADQTHIDITVQLDSGETIPFHYTPEDTEPVSLAVKALLASGTFTTAPYVAPTPALVPTGQSSVIAD